MLKKEFFSEKKENNRMEKLNGFKVNVFFNRDRMKKEKRLE